MGLIQNKVTVSQPNSHVVVKNAGGLRGLTGETGPQGPQGVPGEAATVTAGTTTTLPAGSDATVQNVGSTSAAIFNFGIPKGDKGDTGETGTAATISVGTTTTLEPGEDATVTNSGTSSAAVFDFGIPQGEKGDTGSQGVPGVDGFSPTATVSKTGDTATITITDKDGTTTAQISDGVTPTIDPELSPTSENPVQNKVVTNALAGKEDKPIIVSSLPATGTEGQEYLVDDRYNTVTELKGDTEQTTYSGKNLYEGSPSFNSYNGISAWKDGGTYNGMPVIKRAAAWTGAYRLINIEAGVTYTFSAWVKSDEARTVAIYAIGSGATATIAPNNKNITTTTSWERVSFTFTCSTSGTVALRFENTSASTTNYTYISGYQLEKNSSATSFEPYVGGTASPNPDYPQEVQTVTGRQVVTISDGGSESQEYEINLGDIELCKIGTYRDYIYKSGEDWYVHKETGKVTFTGAETETWSSATAATGYVRFSTASGETHADNNGYCNELINRGSQSHGAYEYVWVQPNANAFYIQVLNTRANDLSSFRTWLGTNPATVYYDIATATDTQITDATLIAQLDALAGAKIMVDGGTATVTSQYLPATLTTAYNSNSGYLDYIYDGTNFVKVR